jgi:hypothetical protein
MATKKLKPQAIKILKMAHILFGFSWTIGAIALCLLLFITHPESGDELFMRSRMLQIIDDYFIIAGAMGALITGLIYSIWTNWGFFKHPWIIVKWILIILQILTGTFILATPLNNNVAIADLLRDTALTDPAFISNIQTLKIVGTIQTVFLLFVIVISVQKPWKKRSL